MNVNVRGSGLLLHITSLPSRFGIGDLGPAAYRFADFLAEARQHYWQVLPLNPTDPAMDHSPYNGTSAFASNPLVISPELLVEEGLIDPADLTISEPFPDRIDFPRVIAFKERLFNLACGARASDDSLPAVFGSQPLADGPARGRTVPLDGMRSEFYRRPPNPMLAACRSISLINLLYSDCSVPRSPV
jgi:hypothetical protein